MDLAAAWAQAYGKVVVSDNVRWKQVTGPVTALIAMLKELGIEATTLHKWAHRDGTILLSSIMASQADREATLSCLLDAAEAKLLERTSSQRADN